MKNKPFLEGPNKQMVRLTIADHKIKYNSHPSIPLIPKWVFDQAVLKVVAQARTFLSILFSIPIWSKQHSILAHHFMSIQVSNLTSCNRTAISNEISASSLALSSSWNSCQIWYL